MFKKIRSKADARLYFMFLRLDDELSLKYDLSSLKTELIRLGYIEHVEGDRYTELKKMKIETVKNELLELKSSGK